MKINLQENNFYKLKKRLRKKLKIASDCQWKFVFATLVICQEVKEESLTELWIIEISNLKRKNGINPT